MKARKSGKSKTAWGRLLRVPVVLFLALAAICGVMFLTGKTSPSGENEWVTYARAQLLGDPQSQYITAIVYDAGRERDEAKAIEWYSKAAAQGHVPAMMGLADIYDHKTDANSRTLAAHWYAEAARNGDGRAQFQLAQYHLKGWGGLKTDPAKIAQLLQQSADAGYGPALTRYGVELRAQGKLDEALPWFRKGAARGDLEALYSLGEIYSDPVNGDLTDVIRAVTYFEEAANLGHVPSQLKYAYLCLGGQGVPRDPVEAYKWAEIAASSPDASHHEQAQQVRDYLRSQLTIDQQQSGEARAKAWLQAKG